MTTTPARGQRPPALVDRPENLVLIPTLKHREVTAWFARPNSDLGGQTLRAYLRGKNWDERYRVGLWGLLERRILTP